MVEARKTIFISCGQCTDEERDLGKRVCSLVEECTPFQGYFAQNQATLKALSENVLRRLYESVGLIVIMHRRGKIEGRDTIRASVWIEQEVAMATLMEQVLGRPLHVELFVQPGIAIEGIRQQIQLNPIEFTNNDEVIARLREILPTWKGPRYIGDDERQKMAESVMLSIRTDNGYHRNYTIQVENHSNLDVEIKCIALWSKGQRVGKPAFPPANVHWSIPAHRTIPIQFDANEDVAHRLWNIAGSPELSRRNEAHIVWPEGQFNSEVRIELRCEVMGFDRIFDETGTVQVDFRNRHIRGL